MELPSYIKYFFCTIYLSLHHNYYMLRVLLGKDTPSTYQQQLQILLDFYFCLQRMIHYVKMVGFFHFKKAHTTLVMTTTSPASSPAKPMRHKTHEPLPYEVSFSSSVSFCRDSPNTERFFPPSISCTMLVGMLRSKSLSPALLPPHPPPCLRGANSGNFFAVSAFLKLPSLLVFLLLMGKDGWERKSVGGGRILQKNSRDKKASATSKNDIAVRLYCTVLTPCCIWLNFFRSIARTVSDALAPLVFSFTEGPCVIDITMHK